MMKALPFLLLLLVISCKPTDKVSESQTTQDKNTTQSVTKDATQDLTRYGIANHPDNILGGLEVGDMAPDFELTNQEGKLMSLSNQLVYSDVLLVFYRGHWCPICNRHLAAFQQELTQLQASGINVLAITPDNIEDAMTTSKKNELSFPILSDSNNEVMRKYKVLFHREKKEDEVLPVPATYLIGQDHKIKYVHYDTNYKSRSNVNDIVAAKGGK